MQKTKIIGAWTAVLAFSLSTSLVGATGTATAALAMLQAGNARFVAQASAAADIGAARRTAVASAQHPFAIVLSCADSRVPPEHIFNVGLGDLFVVRVAGQVSDRSVLASLEYAAEHLDVPLLVVMGHETCGAVKATVESDGATLGPNLDYMRQAIASAIGRSPAEQDRLRAAILANVDGGLARLLADSQILRERALHGQLTLVGAYYELATGKVVFSQPLDPTRIAAGVPHHR